MTFTSWLSLFRARSVRPNVAVARNVAVSLRDTKAERRPSSFARTIFKSRSTRRARSAFLSRSDRATFSDRATSAAERLEVRTLPAVSVLNVSGTLEVTATGADNITVRANGAGAVEVLDQSGIVGLAPTISAASVTGITITGSDSPNVIDLSGIAAAQFSSLASILVSAGDGADAITAAVDVAGSFDGGDGNDTLVSQAAGDTLDGGDGDDSIIGAAGNDSVLGGDGQDSIDSGDGDDTVLAGYGDDSVDVGAGADSVYGDNGADTILGGDGNDTLNGDGGTDLINGQAGDDSILGGDLNDSLLGDAGDDTLNGQAGNDVLQGEIGSDFLSGGDGNDSIDGGDNNDTLNGQGGSDTLIGGVGNDSVLGGAANDSMLGGEGDDTLNGQGGDDSLTGGTGNDRLQGGDANDFIQNNVPTVVVSDVAVAEGDSGFTQATFTLTLSRPTFDEVRISVNTADGSAVAGSDYQPVSGQLVFAPGETSKAASVLLIGDTTLEFNETLQLLLSNPVNTTIGTASAICTVVNDDGPGFISTRPNVNVSHLGTLDTQIPPNPIGANQSGVTIAVNPTNPLNLIATSNNLDDITRDDVSWFSIDGGQTWTISNVPDGFDTPNTGDRSGRSSEFGRTSVVFDRTGTAYLAHLTLADYPGSGITVFSTVRVEVVTSFDQGRSWGSITEVTGPFSFPSNPAFFVSGAGEPLMTIGPDQLDPTRDRIVVGYGYGFFKRQFISSSLDGINWSSSIPVQDTLTDGYRSRPAIGPNGEVYLAWEEAEKTPTGAFVPGINRIMFDRSSDAGQTWNTDSLVIRTNVGERNDPFLNSNGIDGVPDSEYEIPAQPEYGIASSVSIDVDRSNGPHRGRIYLAYIDQADLDGDPDVNNAVDHHNTDIFLIGSDDNGTTWNALGANPIRVNDDATTSSQFLPWLKVDQATGDVAIGWYDARNDLGNGAGADTDNVANSDVEFFVSMSLDGGQTFLPNVRLSAASSNQDRADATGTDRDFDEYVGVTVLNGELYAAWTDNSNSDPSPPNLDGNLKQEVYFARTTLVRPNIFPTITPRTVTGVDGFDSIFGDGGGDIIFGGNSSDLLNGGLGNDNISGFGGDDSILGGAGVDTINGGDGNDTLDGQGGNDVVEGGSGEDMLIWNGAADGNDTMSNASGYDTVSVNGTAGGDTLAVGKTAAGLMTVTDTGVTLVVPGTIGRVIVNGNAGNDTITVGTLTGVAATTLTINGGDGNDTLSAAGVFVGTTKLRMNGDAGEDSLTGSMSDDTIDGGDGDDTALAGLGNDVLLGGAGVDRINGEEGNDTILGGDGNDVLRGFTGNDSLLGEEGNDTLFAGDGNDTASGGAGNDSLTGDVGNDSLNGDAAMDTINGNDGADTIDGGTEADSITGDLGDDLIRGNHGADTIDSGDGNDSVIGGDGNDSITGGNGNDAIHGGDGNDVLNGGAGRDSILGGNGHDILLGGADADTLLGGDGDDTLNGQGSTDVISTGEGTDINNDATFVLDEGFTFPAALLATLA